MSFTSALPMNIDKLCYPAIVPAVGWLFSADSAAGADRVEILLPVIRFHTKTLLYSMKYKVTIMKTAGRLNSFPYRFILEVLGTV